MEHVRDSNTKASELLLCNLPSFIKVFIAFSACYLNSKSLQQNILKNKRTMDGCSYYSGIFPILNSYYMSVLDFLSFFLFLSCWSIYSDLLPMNVISPLFFRMSFLTRLCAETLPCPSRIFSSTPVVLVLVISWPKLSYRPSLEAGAGRHLPDAYFQ